MIMDQNQSDHLKQIGELLQTSINAKDKENAEKYAGILARRGVKVTVTVEVNAQNDSQNNEFSIKVYVEDREASGGCISLKVKPTDTVQDLKNKMFLKHNFPVEVQKWIIGKRIPPDKETLHKARVTGGQAVYLYLVSAKSVKLKKEEYLAQREQLVINQGNAMFSRPLPVGESGDYTTLGSPLTPLTPYSQATPNTPNSHGHAFNKQKSKEGTVKGRQIGQGQIEQKLTLQKPLPAEPLDSQPIPEIRQETVENTPEPHVKPKEQKPQQIGWQCPDCTFINLPTRPGCEICTRDRPKTYVIPEGYRMTGEEEERLRRESELEKQVERAADVRRPGEVTDEDDDDVIENLPEDHLHALLQLNDELQQQYRAQQERQLRGIPANAPPQFQGLQQQYAAQQERQPRANPTNTPPQVQGQIPLNIPPLGGHAPQQYVRNPIPTTNELQGSLDDLQFPMEPREIDFSTHDETD